jgi:hypothetical protein
MDEPIELLVRHPKSDAKAHLIAPDVYGEFFDDQWSDRKWPVSYRTRLASLAGVFVFINAMHNGRNSEMTEAWRNLPLDGPVRKAKQWMPRAAARQVKLVDLLQLVIDTGQMRKPLPVAVMISAWDVVEHFRAPNRRPQEFLRTEWSLVDQYLTANPELFHFRIFGVSARGGDDAAQAELTRLPPHERVWLKDGAEVSKDLTRPLRFLLGWD